MSWQDYVDKQLMASRCVTKAAIAGHDGNVWAKSEGFEVSFSVLFLLYVDSGLRKYVLRCAHEWNSVVINVRVGRSVDVEFFSRQVWQDGDMRWQPIQIRKKCVRRPENLSVVFRRRNMWYTLVLVLPGSITIFLVKDEHLCRPVKLVTLLQTWCTRFTLIYSFRIDILNYQKHFICIWVFIVTSV